MQASFRTPRAWTCVITAAAAVCTALTATSAAGASCASPANEIEAENCLPGAPESEWGVSGAGSPAIQGFATDFSVDQDHSVDFKVDTPAADYRLDIYRMGWYGGNGARHVATIQPSATLPQTQPACREEAATGLIDCANWSESATWSVPANATSGIYFARLVREDGTAGSSHVYFIVRDDDGRSDLLFQTSDTTWQAYNAYGGSSLYVGGLGTGAGRAYKVSYNRPLTTRDNAIEDAVFNSEYPMVRWLERNGYDVSYFTGVDSDRLGAELREHKAFLSVGHDEYWSARQRANVEAARDAGVHLAFFSGNEVFWKTRWEDGHRTLVSYKETHAGAKIDPAPGVWTGTWRDARPFNPEGARPENALTGTIFSVNSGSRALRVPAAEGRLRLWRSAGLPPGATATLAADTVGYEWDEDIDNGARPPGLVRLSETTASGVEKLQDYGSTYALGTATHRLTLYRDTNGGGADALVFGAGTVQWSWGLDGEHDRGGSTPSVPMQQATANLFADMLVQPATLQAGLTRATASTDATAPTSVPGAPTRNVIAGNPVTVSGTAVDRGGGRVGGVEVSVDGGVTWHPAAGRESWSYRWTPAVSGRVTVRSRAVDDSGNLEGAVTSGGGGGRPGAGRTSPQGGAMAPAGAPLSRPAATPNDRTAPRVRVRPRIVRASRRGRVALRLTCPPAEQVCRVDLRLRGAGSSVARNELVLAGGQTRRIALRLSRSTRRRLARSRSLRIVAVATARDPAGNRATTRTRIRVLAPRTA
jgi:Bacterial Ig domain